IYSPCAGRNSPPNPCPRSVAAVTAPCWPVSTSSRRHCAVSCRTWPATTGWVLTRSWTMSRWRWSASAPACGGRTPCAGCCPTWSGITRGWSGIFWNSSRSWSRTSPAASSRPSAAAQATSRSPGTACSTALSGREGRPGSGVVVLGSVAAEPVERLQQQFRLSRGATGIGLPIEADGITVLRHPGQPVADEGIERDGRHLETGPLVLGTAGSGIGVGPERHDQPLVVFLRNRQCPAIGIPQAPYLPSSQRRRDKLSDHGLFRRLRIHDITSGA